jgi:flagellar basal-body rod protein FlgC
MDNTLSIFYISAAGIRAQGTRLRVLSENVANAESTSLSPGGDPYQRKVVNFRSMLDRASGSELISVDNVGRDPTPFIRKFDPGHPAADPNGYVLSSNVNALVEIADMREAQRSYEANLNVVKTAKSMVIDTLEILR